MGLLSVVWCGVCECVCVWLYCVCVYLLMLLLRDRVWLGEAGGVW